MVMVNCRALPLMLLPCCRQNAFFSIDIQEIYCHCTYVLKDPFPIFSYCSTSNNAAILPPYQNPTAEIL